MPPATARRRVTLADLTDEDRRAVLEEAREASKRNPTDVPGYSKLSKAEKAIRDLMDARDHLRGCPVQEGNELGRIEAYDATKPANPAQGTPAAPRCVIRCIECGGASVLVGTLEEALERYHNPPAESNENTGGDETP